MKTVKTTVHFTHKYLLNPTNPVIVNLIGAGGTGSQVLSALARINHALTALDHAGLIVRLFDDDIVTEANLGRQLFAHAELGMNKAVALIGRINRFFGTNWKAAQRWFDKSILDCRETASANITISCVDTVTARYDVADILKRSAKEYNRSLYKPLYWMDFGNSRHTGQVLLSTVSNIEQPKSGKFEPVGTLPFITDEFAPLLAQANNDDTPSCSLAEALTKQDLFINSSLANMGASLLWQLFREGMIEHRGFFMNLKNFKTQPIPVKQYVVKEITRTKGRAKRTNKQAA